MFQRFHELRVDADFVEEFKSSLEVGRTYRAAVQRDGEGKLRLVADHISVPYHHGAALDWANADDYPLLGTRGEETIEFTIMSLRVWQRGNQNQFVSLYTGKIASAP